MSEKVMVRIVRDTFVKGKLVKAGNKSISMDKDDARKLLKHGRAVPAEDQVKEAPQISAGSDD